MKPSCSTETYLVSLLFVKILNNSQTLVQVNCIVIFLNLKYLILKPGSNNNREKKRSVFTFGTFNV